MNFVQTLKAWVQAASGVITVWGISIPHIFSPIHHCFMTVKLSIVARDAHLFIIIVPFLVGLSEVLLLPGHIPCHSVSLCLCLVILGNFEGMLSTYNMLMFPSGHNVVMVISICCRQ